MIKNKMNKCMICDSPTPMNKPLSMYVEVFMVIKCNLCGLVVPKEHAIYLASSETYYCKKCATK